VRSLNRALVVGGAGFYGSWLVDALLREGIETTVLDERDRPEAVPGAELIVGDASDVDLVSIVTERKVDAIFQLAGTGLVPESLTRPIDDLLRNARTTLAVLEAARAVDRPTLVAYVSSAAVYGEGLHMPMDESHPLQPLSPYGISKLAAEKYVHLYARLYGTPAFSVRPFSLYGPRQRKLVVYDLLARAVAGEDPLVVRAPADVSRDFVYVEDAAKALVTLVRTAPAAGESYNFASGQATTLRELVATLLQAAELTPEVQFSESPRPGDPLRWDGDAQLARALGASFDTPLAEGLRRTVEWYLETSPARARGGLLEALLEPGER
jgi:UDP-glucose 4-epimerase